MHPKKAAASFAWWLWLCWGHVSPGWWLTAATLYAEFGCPLQEGAWLLWGQVCVLGWGSTSSIKLPKFPMDKHRAKAPPSPDVGDESQWLPLWFACSLLPPTNSTCLPCHCCPSPLPLPRPLCPLQPPNPSIPPQPGPLRPVSPVSRNALTPSPPLQNGLTPLHVAAHYDNQKVALLLLEKGASPHATAKVSQPARHEGSPGGAGPGTASGPFIAAQR